MNSNENVLQGSTVILLSQVHGSMSDADLKLLCWCQCKEELIAGCREPFVRAFGKSRFYLTRLLLKGLQPSYDPGWKLELHTSEALLALKLLHRYTLFTLKTLSKINKYQRQVSRRKGSN